MADSVLDGMVGWYVKEGFPIYYINDNMLKLLGYEDEKHIVRQLMVIF